MCEAVEKYGDKVAEQKTVNLVRSLMDSMKWSVDQAMTALKNKSDERDIIANQLKK